MNRMTLEGLGQKVMALKALRAKFRVMDEGESFGDMVARSGPVWGEVHPSEFSLACSSRWEGRRVARSAADACSTWARSRRGCVSTSDYNAHPA